MTRSPGQHRLKRLMDLAGAGIGLLVLGPVMAAVAVAVRARLGAPVLFTQDRPGLGGRIFKIYKFRTMTDACDEHGNLLNDAARLTPLGRFLRGTSLDELPQLLNVLSGDLSLVGPRPLLVRYLDHYTPEQNRRHEVPAGITGWAQVHGRNAITWEDRFALDVWYVDNWSLWLDVKILALTVAKVIRREGVSAADHATMTEFTGSGELGPP